MILIILFVISIINIILIDNPHIRHIKRWKEYSLCFQLTIFIIAQLINFLNNGLWWKEIKMKFKYEFECKNLTIEDCTKCPLTYIDTDSYGGYVEKCGLGSDGMDCPLEEVKEDS